MNSKTVILNFANNVGRYAQMQKRLIQALDKVGYKGDLGFFQHEEHIHHNCPYHKSEDPQHHQEGKVVPYAFKAWAINEAVKKGYETIIWMDSAVYPSRDITPFIDHINQHGYIFFDNIGYSVGDYTSDACLNKHGWSREKAFGAKMIMACLMGFNTKSLDAKKFIHQYFEAAKDGISYQGSWNNANGEVSEDMRVKGHRHDQSVASMIIHDMKLTITNAQDTFFAYTSHKGILKIADSVCLWSEGI
ncbi:MAG: hypothetical protein K0S44_202 [Bacteroidetes bacterium]|jgi:hypothetical protein|nr:hypothetical protein [Bacteroidota bacterium]